MSAKFPRGGGEQTHSQPSVYKCIMLNKAFNFPLSSSMPVKSNLLIFSAALLYNIVLTKNVYDVKIIVLF